MAENKRLQQIYNALKTDGQFSQTKDYNTFAKRMNERGYSSQIWKNLKQAGADVGKNPWEMRKWLGIQEFAPKHQNSQNGATSQPQTAAQRAISQGYKQKASNPSSSTDYMQNWKLMHKRGDQMTPIEQAQANTMRSRMQKAQNQATLQQQRQATPISQSRVTPNAKNFNETMQQLSTPQAKRERAVQQRQDDAMNLAQYEVEGNQFTHNDGKMGTISPEIDSLVAPSMKEADDLSWKQYQQDLKKAGGNAYLRNKAWKDLQDNRIKNRQETLANNLSAKLQEIYSQKWLQEHIVESADKLNMGVEEYVDKYVTPQMMHRAQSILGVKNIEEIMPKSATEYVVKRLSDSILGTLSAGLDKSKDQRIREQEAMAIADGLEEMPTVKGYKGQEGYKSGVAARFVSTAANMAMDSPILGMTGGAANLSVDLGKQVLTRGLAKVGLIKAGAKLTAQQMAFKAANMTMAQKIGSGLIEGTAKGALNLGGYSSITSALGQASTGDDTSLSALGHAALEGFEHGAKTGAMFGVSGAIMAPWVSKFGINGMETSRGQRILHGAQKLGATGVGLGVEAGTMMVADNLTGDKDISVGTWLEDLVMVGAFKAGEPKNYAHIGSALYGLTHNTNNTFRVGKDEKGNWRTVDIRMTKDEQNELVNSVSGKNLVEAFQKVDKSSLNSKTPLDKSITKQAYQDFMNDPNVSQSTKEKVNAAMGLFNTTSDRSYRSVNDAKNKQILEYSKNGTLLTRTSYKNADERRAILYKQKTYRNNDELVSLIGYARLKDREILDEKDNVKPLAVRFLQEKGYDTIKDATDPQNAALISQLRDTNSGLYEEWVKYADKYGIVGTADYDNVYWDESTLGTVKELFGVENMKHGLLEIMSKDPMKRNDRENEVLKNVKNVLETKLFPDGKPHDEQSISQGESVAEDNNLGTEQPNGEVVRQELNNLSNAEKELETFIHDNDIFGQNFEKFQKQGLTNPQIYDWMIQNGLTEEQLAPFAHYINANARVQGMQNATAQKIEEKVSAYGQDWAFHGTMNGQKAEGENALFVKDSDGRTLIVGSGDVAFDSNGRAKEDVGDMLVCLDPSTSEVTYVKAEDVTLAGQQPREQFEAEYRQKLQMINSQPYNEAMQEQAMKDAGKPSESGKTTDTTTASMEGGTALSQSESIGKGTENNPSVQENPELYKVANALQGKVGGSLSEEEASNLTTEMESRAEKPRDLQLTPDNWYAEFGEDGKVVTPIGEVKMGENQVSKLFEKGRSKEFGMIKPTLENPDAIIEVPSSAADGKEERPSSYLFVKTFLGKNGEKVYYFKSVTVKKDGMKISISSHYDRAKRVREALEKGKLLYLKGGGAQTEQNQPSVSGATSEEVSAGSSTGKDTNNSSNGNGSETTLTFEDGTLVPIKKDSKGRPTPDYDKMTPEQAAEILVKQLGESAEPYVNAQIKKAEKEVKKAEKMKIDFNGEPNDVIEQQQVKTATIAAAKEQLEHAQNIKKAMTAKAVADTVAKPSEGEKVDEANQASPIVKEKFDKSKKVAGRRGSITLPGGIKIKGTYYYGETSGLTPSHDPFNDFKQSEGFPVNEDGTSSNSRSYKDKGARQFTIQIGNNFNGLALKNVPVVQDGIILSGNGTVMGKLLAERNGKDGQYHEDLNDNIEGFGLTTEKIAEVGNKGTIYFVPDEKFPLTSKTFDMFNKQETKSESNTEQAVAKAKTLTPDEVGAIVADIEGNGSLEAFFNNSKAINDLIKTLQEKGVIGQNEVEGYMDGPERLSAQGKEFVKNLLLGSVFKPETIRMLGYESSLKNKAIAGIRAIMENLKLGDYSLRDEIDHAIQLMYEAKKAKSKSVAEHMRTNDIYGSPRERYTPMEQAIAQALDGSPSLFRDLINEYNNIAKTEKGTGETEMFDERLTPEELVKAFLESSNIIKNNDIKLYGNEESRNREQEAGNHDESHEEPAKEAGGAANPEGKESSESESQQRVDESLKSIATEITKQTGIEVVTDDNEAQKVLDEAENIKMQHEAGGAVLDWGNVPSKARLANDELTTIIMQNNRAYIDELDKLSEGETIEHYVDANGYFYTFRVDKNHHIYIDEAIPKTSSANKERINELKNYYNEERARHIETVRSDRGETQSELGRSTDSDGSTIGGRDSQDSTVGRGSERTDTKGNVERDSSRSKQSSSPIKEFRSANGEVYGFTVDGKIYLDTKKMKPETPLHEYTHLWTEALRNGNPKEWENVKKLFDEVDGLKEEVQKLYPELKGDDLYEEMITTFSGREGAKKLEEVVRGLAKEDGKSVEESSKAKGFIAKVKEALQKYWKGVADMLHIHFTSAEEVADKVLADWAKGFNPKLAFDINEQDGDYVRNNIEYIAEKTKLPFGKKYEEELTTEEVKSLFYSNSDYSKEYGKLFERVFDVAKKLGIKISFKIPPATNVALGQHVSDNVYLSPLVLAKGKHYVFPSKRRYLNIGEETIPHVMLHELIHSVTDYALDRYETNPDRMPTELRKATKSLIDLYEAVKVATIDYGDYGRTDVYEFIAELSNPRFCKLLKKTNVWTRVKDSVKEFFFTLFSSEKEKMDKSWKETNSYKELSSLLDNFLENSDKELFREEADREAIGDLDGDNNPSETKQEPVPVMPKPVETSNPIEKAAEEFHEDKIESARKAYAEAKEGGNADEIKHAAGQLKALLNEKYKAQGMGFVQRQKEIAKEIGKAEAEKIDKPWEKMDLEEREAVSSKNPLTEDEINNLTSEENKELIPAALAYLRGDKGNIVNAISYFKIWNDVRNRHEDAPDNSGAKDGTQLDATDTTGSEGLGLGTGRESGGVDGQLDRGTGNETSSREPERREGNQNDPTLSSGEPSDKQGEGKSSSMGTVSTRDSDIEGSGTTGKDGNEPQQGGRGSSDRPAKSNAERKPATKQGTHFPNSTREQLKNERAEYEKRKADFFARFKKAGQGYAKIALTPFKKLNLTPEQIEMLPELFKIHLDGAVLKIKEGIYKFKEWKAAMMDEAGKELKMIGLSDDDVDRFMDDYWNTPYKMDGETHTIAEWSSIYGQEQVREKLKEPLNEKYQRQMDAETIKVKVGDRKNIEETLPFLLPQQQEDVLKAETQFFGKEHTDRDHAYGKGYMFTNGTGTGKTYTGLGIAKRLAKQGKGRILFVTPSQKKVSDWMKDGKNLGLDIRDLDSIAKEKGTTATTESGDGMVITTYANMRQNKKLLETDWDAVIYDESHRIMENKKGAETTGSMQHYMVTNRDENHCFLRLQTINPHYQKMQRAADRFNDLRQKEVLRIQKEYKQSHPSATMKDIINATHGKLPKELQSFAPADGMTFPKLGKAYQDFTQAKQYYYNNVEPKLKEQAKNTWKNTKTIFLSATPFNTRENLDYAEGYIFKYPESDGSRMSGRTRFYLDHFGAAYKYRYNRLEQSISNPAAVSKQEIAFSDYLQNTLGTMSGRIIDSQYDYSRDFPTVSPDHADEFNNAVQEAIRGSVLSEAYHKTIGDYNYGSALFETMKVANIIQRMKDHLDAGRKIVVFHRRVETKEPLAPPFATMLSYANNLIKEMKPGEERNKAIKEVTEFREKHQDLLNWEQTLDYSMPREQIVRAFGKDNVLFFSGKENKNTKSKAVDAFNDDNSGKNIIVIQEASGKEGISLHDTTGNHQRVLITLGLPQSPITALQIEGRTYRIGNKSNAIFEYPILGLNSEMMLFGEKFNNQVSTTENLVLGSQARNLRDSFAKGILEHSGVVPIDQQGVGGKEFDAPKQSDSDPYDDAVLDYYSNQKLNRNNREGVDYFPTPEPLGYKMVEWANMGEGDTALEPSAGHGAIARYVPNDNELVSVEPSQSLFTKLQLKAGGLGRKFLNNTFENYDIKNKHDVVVMNPPFGTAGATAIAHLDKAFKHLDEGGRIVAIIPRGSTDKKFDKWYDGQKNVAMRAEVDLPDIVFQQAGTNVRCRVVVLDKITDDALRSKAGYPEKIDLSGRYDKIEDFFEDLRNVEIPDRIVDTQLKAMKKARSLKNDLKDIKGVQINYIDKNGVSVFDKNTYRDYSINFPSIRHNKEWYAENYSKIYEVFDQQQKNSFNENSKAALDEMKKLACKLADMTEDEMQRYIESKKNGGSEEKVHFRTEESSENENSSEKLFLSLQQKSNNKKEYNDTVTELANRVKQGTARITGEVEEGSRSGSSPNYGGVPAIAGKILNGENKQGRGQSGEMVGGASERKGQEVLSTNAVYAKIEDWAKENNCYFTEDEIAKESLDGEVWKSGAEAYVYRSKDGKSAIKVMSFDPYYSNPIDYYLDRNRYFNEAFPDTAIEVMGYGRDNNGKPTIFYKQPLIEGETVLEHFKGDEDKANEYVDNMLASMGFDKKVPHDEWGCMADSNGKLNVFDVNYENVIIDKNGKPHVIDAEVLPVDYKNDGKIEIKDNDSDAHFRSENNSPVKVSDNAPVVVKRVAEVAKKVGGKINMVNSAEEVTNPQAKAAIEAGKKITGWYDEKTGEVHLYMPNIHDSYTAEKTIWHEVVGHKGLRELFGEDRFRTFLREVWDSLDKPENAELKKLVDEERRFNPFNVYDAIEEALARFAEDGKGEAGFWRNLKNKVSDFLHEIGYRIAPNTKDVKYLLWLSKNLQKHPNDPYWKMRAEAVKYRLDHEDVPTVIDHDGVFYDNDGKTHDMNDMTKAEWNEATDGQIHFRTTPSAGTAIDRYHRALDAHGYMATESYMDNMLSMKKLMTAIVPDKKIEDIASSENPYMLQNTMQGAMSDAAKMFEINEIKPLNKAMAQVLDAFDGKKENDKIRNFNLYMIAKHGLERNRVFFVRDYIAGLDPMDGKTLQKKWDAEKKDLGDQLRKGSIDLKEYYNQMDEWIRNNVDKDFKPEEHDYSGFHGMQKIDDLKAPYDDNKAIQDVIDSEARMEGVKKGSVKDLWSKIHSATSYSLYRDYAGGFHDRETYTHTSQMFDWYVPLRKFDDKTAEDVYGYVTEKGDPSSYLGSVLMSAKGRKSLSEVNVLAQIGAMGNMAINNAGKNAIKQAFMRFARNHNSDGLITEGKVWLVKDGTNADGSDRWVETYPQIPDGAAPKTVSNIVSKFEADMKAKKTTGDAKVLRNNGDIGFKFEKAKDKSQHIVDVKVNGQTHRFYINGNPRAAQALNGLLEHKAGAFGKPFSIISRFMAQTCTSYNPEFVMRNMIRDFEFASTNLLAKEGARYTATFEKYYAKVGLIEGLRNTSIKDLKGTTGFGLYAKYRNGTLDTSDKIQKYFKEFMENGGETGWVQVKSIKDWETEYKRNIKTEKSGARKVGKGIYDVIFGNLENINEVAENMARFATYCASRDFGRSTVRSAYDAKEVSTNFNRHGSGSEIKSFKNGEMSGFQNFRKQTYRFTSAYLRNTSMFFNAGVQSTNLLIKNLKNNTAGTVGYVMAGPMISGMMMALVNNFFIANEDEKDRNGVKDPYGELPDYIRRNNLCVYIGKGEFVTIPLAIEERAFYGLGDLAAGLTFSKNIGGQKNPWLDGVGCISQLVPVADYLGNSSFGKNPVQETVKAVLPSATSPFVEWAYNSDWKGAPIERENKFDENQPAWMLAYKGTPDYLINLNKKVNALTNDVAPGNENMKGNDFLDAVTNPSGINHFVSGYLGGAATFTNRVIGLAKHGSDTETKDIPFIRSLLYTPSEQSSLQRTKSKWYNYKDEMEKTISNVNRLKSKNVPLDQKMKNYADYVKFQNSAKARMVDEIERAEKQIKRWNGLKKKASDTESIKNADRNIEAIMQRAVTNLDAMQ